MYRARIDSFGQLPKDKRPPRDLWDKPYALEEFLEHIWDKNADKKGTQFYEFDEEDVE